MKVCPVSRYADPRFPTRAALDAHPEILRALPERWRGHRVVLAALAGACALWGAQRSWAAADGSVPPPSAQRAPSTGNSIWPETAQTSIEVRLQGDIAVPTPPTPLTSQLTLTSLHHALLADDTTLLPARAVAEWAGAEVRYDGSDGKTTITQGDTTVILIPRSARMSINGRPVMLDVPVTVRDGKTYVQARPFANALKEQVTWDAKAQQVTVGHGARALQFPVTRVQIGRHTQHMAMGTGSAVNVSPSELAQFRTREAVRAQLRDFIAWLKAEDIV